MAWHATVACQCTATLELHGFAAYPSMLLNIASSASKPAASVMRRQPDDSLVNAVSTNPATVNAVWTSPPSPLHSILMSMHPSHGTDPAKAILRPLQPSSNLNRCFGFSGVIFSLNTHSIHASPASTLEGQL